MNKAIWNYTLEVVKVYNIDHCDYNSQTNKLVIQNSVHDFKSSIEIFIITATMFG